MTQNLAEQPRPRPRWHHSAGWLDDLAIVSWAVDPDRLAHLLPTDCEPIRFLDESGRSQALVSLVAFTDRDFQFNFWPLTQIHCGQVNYRAYVRYQGKTGVWFFHTSLDSAWVVVPRRLWSMPWYRDRVTVTADWQVGRLLRYSATARGNLGSLELELAGTSDEPAIHPLAALGMTDPRGVSDVYTDPVRGWFQRADGRIGAYSVWHARMQMVRAEAVCARSGVFEGLGLVTAQQAPIDARAIRAVRFDVHTPARVSARP